MYVLGVSCVGKNRSGGRAGGPVGSPVYLWPRCVWKKVGMAGYFDRNTQHHNQAVRNIVIAPHGMLSHGMGSIVYTSGTGTCMTQLATFCHVSELY